MASRSPMSKTPVRVVGPGGSASHSRSTIARRLRLLLGVASSVWLLHMAGVLRVLLRRPADEAGGIGVGRYSSLPDNIKIESFSGRHIAFMGDSITRYQYLSLVAFLEYGSFPGNEATWETPEGTQLQNPTWEGLLFSSLLLNSHRGAHFEIEKWAHFFNVTNAQLRGHEVCDCYRPGDSGDSMPYMNENRYYHNPMLNISVSLLFWRGSAYPLQGRLVPEDGGPYPAASPERSYQSMGCRPSQCAPPFAWVDSPEETILKHFMALRPTDFVANAGAWPIDKVNWEAVASAGELLCKKTHQGCNLFWKTTTPLESTFKGGCLKVNHRQHTMHEEMVQHGWHEFDAFRMICDMKGDLHVDPLHFIGDAYAMLNRELLRRIYRRSSMRHRHSDILYTAS